MKRYDIGTCESCGGYYAEMEEYQEGDWVKYEDIKPLLILQELYDSEINVRLRTFFDAGFHACLGDEWDGFREGMDFPTLAEACEYLKQQAIEHFPESKFAQKYKGVT